MPTASIKAEKEKQPPSEANDPLRQGITLVEHKIRNLEKRKSRLDGYKEIKASGKELNSDQLSAIEKYDEVIQTLEFARDLAKQLNGFSTDYAKTIKKQLRKEAIERTLHEITRTKEILIIQDILSNLGQENVRDDLISGRAKVTLSSDELTQIDELFQELSPKQDPPVPYTDQFQSCSEHLASLIDGKNKEAFGTTYAALKTKLMEIATSGYFDPPQTKEAVKEEPVAHKEVIKPEAPEITPVYSQGMVPPPVMQEVSQVESALFLQQQQLQQQQQQQQQQPPPQPYALHQLPAFKAVPIDFIQDNEIEEPADDKSIPTLTYTNQNYTPNSKEAPGVIPTQPEPPQVFQQVPQPTPQPEPNPEDEWTSVGGGGGDAQPREDWNEGNADDSWQETNHWQGHHQANNDGFIPAGGGRGNRGGRGRGGRGGPNNRSGQPRPNSSNRGAYRDREGGYNRDGGYNNREGGYNNREGGYNNRDGGGYNKDGGQNYHQNGYRGSVDRERRGGGRNYTGERGGGGRGSRGGPRGGSSGNFRGGGNNFRQHQQQ